MSRPVRARLGKKRSTEVGAMDSDPDEVRQIETGAVPA